jgi:broad specificity phosphatase PhoE
MESFVDDARDATDHARRTVVPQHGISDYYGQKYYRAGTTVKDLPVLDPMYNLRKATQQLLEIEEDLREHECTECIGKQVQDVMAEIDEAIELDQHNNHRIPDLLTTVQKEVATIAKQIETDQPRLLVLQTIRALRKYMGRIAYGAFS